MGAHVLLSAFVVLALGVPGGAAAPNSATDLPALPTAPAAIERHVATENSTTRTLEIAAGTNLIWVAEVPTIVVTHQPARQAHSASPSTQRHGGYSFAVRITGHQAALDRCAGFVWEKYGTWGNVVSAHNRCGGAVILKLRVGDYVTLKGFGAGTYRVSQIKAVPKNSSASVLQGHLWMQTCYFTKPMLRLVRLSPVD